MKIEERVERLERELADMAALMLEMARQTNLVMAACLAHMRVSPEAAEKITNDPDVMLRSLVPIEAAIGATPPSGHSSFSVRKQMLATLRLWRHTAEAMAAERKD